MFSPYTAARPVAAGFSLRKWVQMFEDYIKRHQDQVRLECN